MQAGDYLDAGLVQTMVGLREERIDAVALAQEVQSRLQRHAGIKAFVSTNQSLVEDANEADDRRRRGDTAPLLGAPISLKDNIDTRALPTTACTPALAGHRPRSNAEVAERLFQAGALLAGKNTMHELAFGATCDDPSYGPVRNPNDPARICGGSSGGTAAAVAAGIIPAGIGTDTGGSVRMPAALCGVAGFRPTVGRWPTQGIVPISPTRDTPGPIARRVEDLALLDAIVTGETPHLDELPLTGLRLGVPSEHFWERLDPATEALCRRAIATFEKRGATMVDANVENVAELDEAVSFMIALHEPRSAITQYLHESGSTLTYDAIVEHVASPDVRQILAATYGADADARALRYPDAIGSGRRALIDAYGRCFEDHGIDALLFPTTPRTANPIADGLTTTLNGMPVDTFPTFIRNTDPGSNAGLPGVTIPAGYASGLPVGLALDGRPGDDRRLLAIALALQATIELGD